MEKHKKYKSIHRIAYIAFFLYLIILAIGNIDFGEYTPHFIIIPFIIYCLITIGIEVLVKKNAKDKRWIIS
jgi:hypothetical protein